MIVNVDPRACEIDSTIWKCNPFYRDPPYRRENVKFKRLCENSMTLIAESCYQSCLLYNKHDADDVDAGLAAALAEIYEIAGGRDRTQSAEEFRVVIETGDESLAVDGVSVVVVPVSSFGAADDKCCTCGTRKHKVVLWHCDGHFYVNIVCDRPKSTYTKKSSNRTSFFNYLLTDLENLLTDLKFNNSLLSEFDVLSLKTDFNNLFEDLDSLLNIDKEESVDEKSCFLNRCSCFEMCEDSTEQVNIMMSHCDCEATSALKDFNKCSLLKHNQWDCVFGKEVNKFFKSDDLPTETPTYINEQTKQISEPITIIDLNTQTESSPAPAPDSGQCVKPSELLSVDHSEPDIFSSSKLPVIQEESYDILAYAKKFYRGRTSSESSDVAEWRRDLWLSGLDDLDEPELTLSAECAEQWFSSTDSEGRVYFFEENSNKSSWTLPENSNLTNNENKVPEEESSSVTSSPITEKSQIRSIKSKSMILATRHEEPSSVSNLSLHWPQLLGGTMCVLKEGPLNKTKITENGKRVRKNWTSTYAVLTELLLLFFKDNKGFPSMMSGKGGPELSVDLNGAVVDVGDKVSSRKNVYMLSTVLGLQVLIQCDCAASAQQWLSAIQRVINNLPSSIEGKGPRTKPESPKEENKPVARVGRSKSMKLKNKSASIEDLSNVAERQTKIKERLKKFFHRRPTVELLVKKGIWKDEPVFGCLLEHACPSEPPRVPLFVQHCVRCVERSEDNMKTDGLYRVSGNLSQVQKIRLQVDQNVYTLLEQEEDVHVLAGTLKLFFRELRQPLIPFKLFDKALRASTNANYNEKIKDFREIVKSLPPCNHDTLKFLLQHLLRVTQFQEFNRMHIPNIAIVFGPTLMWPEQESQNMAFDMMQQNLVIECFLSEFNNIFR